MHLEELRVVVARLADWMDNSSPPWAAYHSLMACFLVALDKRPGFRPVGIGETLRWDLAKLVLRAAEDRVKTVCGYLQLCAGLEAGIEGENHAIRHRRLEWSRQRRSAEEEGSPDEEEESESLVQKIRNLTIETAATEEEAAERLEAVLEMEVDGYWDGEGERGEEGVATQGTLGSL